VAEHFTVVTPTANAAPDAGRHDVPTEPSTRSSAVAAYVTMRPDGPFASAVTSAGRPRTGAVVSTTLISNDALPVLLRLSVAEQLTVVVPSANVEPEAGEQLGVSAPSTRSAADAEYVTAAPDAPDASWPNDAGTVSTGAVVSTTVTSNAPLLTLLWLSVALHPTEVVPSPKVDPEDGAHKGVTAPSTTSDAVVV
jgi:hypothetical protein